MINSTTFDVSASLRTTALSLFVAMTMVLVAAASIPAGAIAAEPSPSAGAELDPGASADPAQDVAAAPIEPQFWSDVLVAGDCIIRPPIGELPEPLSCDELHGEEIYAVGRIDLGVDAPYPGDSLSDMVGEQLCDQATIEFAGEPWERAPFASFWLYPTEEEWDAGDRGIMCSAAPAEGDELKIGTAGGGSLDSDDVLLARGSFNSSDFGEFNDWALVREHDTISSVRIISDNRFVLPRRRAWAVPQGFMFHATAPGDDGHATTTWGYGWESGEYTDLGSILPDWELASTMVVDGTTFFAARETPDDDWDLFVSTSEAGTLPLASGSGDQQYPTFTPDRTQIVFHDDGDLVVMDKRGTNRRVLVERDSNAFESSVSPDGTRVAFASDHAGNDDIWVVDLAGGEPVNLTEHPANEAWPVWSEDGSRIYYQTDRLRPGRRAASLMMMRDDGSEASWFSGATVSQALPLDAAIRDAALAHALTLEDRYIYEILEGEPGATAVWEHGSGRLSAQLPVGWRVSEAGDGVGFIAAPDPAGYYATWAADGVVVAIHDGLSPDDFFSLVDGTAAVQSCERFDGTDGIQPFEGTIDVLTANHRCGDEGAVAGVIAFYDNETGVGLLIEGQRDNLPDAETDREMLDAIPRSIVWE